MTLIHSLACLCLALAPIPAAAQMQTAHDTVVALAEIGYRLDLNASGNPVTLQAGKAGTDWRLPANPARFDIWFNGPSERTGDALPELIVIERTSRSAGTVHVLELGPDAPREVLSQTAFITALNALAMLPPGEPLQSVDLPMVPGSDAAVPPAEDRMQALGYSLQHGGDGIGRVFRIRRGGQTVYEVTSFAIRTHGPAYMTGSGAPGMLIEAANSRSFSDLMLIEMTETGIETRFTESGQTSMIRGLFDATRDRVETGEPVTSLFGPMLDDPLLESPRREEIAP